MSRWITIACAALAIAALGIAESYRRENRELRAELRAASSSGATETSASQATPQVAATEGQPANPTAQAPSPDSTVQDPSAALTALPNTDLLALAEELSERGSRPTYIDVQLMRRLQRSSDPRDRAEMARKLLLSPHNEARLTGIRELLSASPAEGIDLLRGFAGDLSTDPVTGDWALARVAVDSLREVPGSAAEQELYRYFDSDSLMFRSPAARALEQRGQAGPMQQLIQGFERDLDARDPQQRIRAISGLMGTRSPSANPTLIRALRDDDPAVRRRAAQAFQLTGDETVVPYLEDLKSDPDPEVRSTASKIIARLSTPDTSRSTP